MIPQWIKDGIKALVLLVAYAFGRKDEKDSIEKEVEKQRADNFKRILSTREKIRQKYSRYRANLPG